MKSQLNHNSTNNPNYVALESKSKEELIVEVLDVRDVLGGSKIPVNTLNPKDISKISERIECEDVSTSRHYKDDMPDRLILARTIVGEKKIRALYRIDKIISVDENNLELKGVE